MDIDDSRGKLSLYTRIGLLAKGPGGDLPLLSGSDESD
jgi:hypothetical protein